MEFLTWRVRLAGWLVLAGQPTHAGTDMNGVFQPEQYFSLPTTQPEQYFGLFNQSAEHSYFIS